MVSSRKTSQAKALKVFRRAAGFQSAETAASHFGWPLSRYRSHESGARRFGPEDVATYASAFRVEVKDIGSPQERVIEDLDRMTKETAYRLGRDAADRLRALRSMAGYGSAAAFCRDWDIVAGTYVKHEDFQNVLNPPAIALYAAIHGIRQEWLASGTLPSGLGDDVDAKIDGLIRNPSKIRDLSSISHDLGSIERLKALLAPGRPSSVGGNRMVAVREFSWVDLEKADGRIDACGQHTTWRIPGGLFSKGRIDEKNFLVVAADRAVDGVAIGERLFVNRAGATTVSCCQSLYFSDGVLLLSDRTCRGLMVGEIVARLRLPFGSSSAD